MHAQAGDGGLPEEVQCPEEAEGNSHTLQAGNRMHGGFVPHAGKNSAVSLGQCCGGDRHLGSLVAKKGKES